LLLLDFDGIAEVLRERVLVFNALIDFMQFWQCAPDRSFEFGYRNHGLQLA